MTGMKKAKCALAVPTSIVFVLSVVSLRSNDMLNMDAAGNLLIIVFWIAFPVTWFIVGLRAQRESTIGFCLLLSVYYSCGLLYWLLRQENQDPTSAGQFRFLVPIVLLIGAPFLVAFESYTRGLVVWLYAKIRIVGA